MGFLFPNSLKSKAWIVLGLLAVFVMVGASGSVFAQSERDMQNRIKRLENEIDTLSRAVYKGETPPAGAFSGGRGADTEVRLQQIETEMRDLRGEIERQSFETRQLKNQLERVSGDLELRLNDLENGRGAVNQGANQASGSTVKTIRTTNAPSAPVAAPSGTGGGYQWNSGGSEAAAPQGGKLGSFTIPGDGKGAQTPENLAAATYENAFSLVKNRQYERAQGEFEIFLKDHPDHALAGNAKYWLGETHYVRGNYEVSARIFAEGYKQFPKGSKAADNLLKLGLSLDAIGKSDDACTALRQLKKENPAGAAPVLRRADQEISRLGC